MKFISIITLLILLSCDKNEPSMVDNAANQSSQNNNGTGISGSTAKVVVVGDYLYSVIGDSMHIINISDPNEMINSNSLNIPGGIETIFPYVRNGENLLFIGKNEGMSIYDISQSSNPRYISEYSHLRSCDPVVVNNNLAFVTLRGNNRCGNVPNELHVLDISSIYSPHLLQSYPLTEPYGLGIDEQVLFVCDGRNGVRVYTLENETTGYLKEVTRITGIYAYDVILHNKIAMVIGTDGLFQYNYNNPHQIEHLSEIKVN